MKEEKFDGKKLILNEKEWKERLSPEQFRILRQKGTETPFDNAFCTSVKEGIYLCAGCSLPLFTSEKKYNSGTGWPSYWEPLYPENISYKKDLGPLGLRIEVICSRCEGHLGHVFNDGPPPSGKRYCLNSIALTFMPQSLKAQ